MRDHIAEGPGQSGRAGHAGHSGHGGHRPQRAQQFQAEHEARHEQRHRHGGFGPGGRGQGAGGMGPGGPGGPAGPGGFTGRGGGRGGRRGPGYGHDAAPPSTDGLAGWLVGRLPGDWFTGAPELTVDRDEVGILGTLPDVEFDGPETERAAAEAGRITRFREETREQRVEIAAEIERRFGRSVAWGAIAGQTSEIFTNLSIPVMTRLRQPERQVLDTLVDGGVARSRADALAWCVRLVGKNAESWLAEIREALTAVEKARANGPDQD